MAAAQLQMCYWLVGMNWNYVTYEIGVIFMETGDACSQTEKKKPMS